MQHFEYTVRVDAELAEYEREARQAQLVADAMRGRQHRSGFMTRFRTWFELTGLPDGMPYADIPFRRLQHQ